MKHKKIILILSFLAVFGLLLNISPLKVKAVSVEEIRAKIAELQAQILQLQEQLTEVEEEPAVWCYDFHLNLKYGMGGTEVRALQTALQKEGFYERAISGTFDEYTASAVVGFQQKYKQDILAPWGLQYGTGYVGKTTLAKLNALYGCGVVTPYIKVISPNGGEQWLIGNTYTIRWSAFYSSTKEVKIALRDTRYGPFSESPLGQVVITSTQNTGSYVWTIPSKLVDSLGRAMELGAGNVYKIAVYTARPGGECPKETCDESDNYFSIVEAEEETCHTTPLWSWNYCSPTCKCEVGEGDCDTDSDCTTGYCAENVGADYGQVASMDICEEKAVEENLPPVVDELTAPTQLKVNQQGSWTIHVSDPENGVLTYTVDWGDESPIALESYGPAEIGIVQATTFTHTYSGVGTYTVSFTITDDHQQTAKISTTIKVVEEITPTCTDSDGGKDYYVKGTTDDGITIGEDVCDLSNLKERYCSEDGQFVTEVYACPYGCQNGACKKGITVTSPNGGEEWLEGEAYKIKWESSGVEKVDILIYGYDSAGTVILSGLLPGGFPEPSQLDADKGYYVWVVNNSVLGYPHYKIEVRDSSNSEIKDLSDNYFSIAEKVEEVTCTDTDGGKDYYVKGKVTDSNIDQEKNWDVCYTLNASGGAVETNSCSGTNCYVSEHYCETSTSIYGSAIGYQCLYGCQDGACKKGITVISPNGGETLIHNGSPFQISWQSTNAPAGSYVELWRMWSVEWGSGERIANNLSPSGSFAWTPQIKAGGDKITGVTVAGDRTYSGYIEARLCKGGSGCYEHDGTLLAKDLNDGPFRINTSGNNPLYVKVSLPNGGETVEAGKTYTIKWTSSEILSNETVQLGYRPMTRSSELGDDIIAQVANTGSYNWVVPSSLQAGQYKIGIFYANKGGTNASYDYSDAPFNITGAVTPVCTDSDGGKDYYTKGSIVTYGNITQTDYCVEGKYLKEYYCSTSQEGAMITFSCPYGCQDGACKKGITVTSPNGGEKWEIGKTYEIKWTDGGVEKVILYLYDYVGTVGTRALSYNVSASDGKYSWTISSEITPGEKFKIAVRDSLTQQQVYDLSDNYFSIVEKKPDLTVTKLEVAKEGTDTVKISYCIKNIGDADSGNFSIKFYNLDNPSWDFGGGGFNSFRPGNEHCSYTTRSGVGVNGGNGYVKGTNRIKLVVDSNNEVKESDETNNELTYPFSTNQFVGCADSDGGKDYYTKGYVRPANYVPGDPNYGDHWDYCFNNTVVEFSCVPLGQGIAEQSQYDCPYGCKDGACLKSSATTTDCPVPNSDLAQGYYNAWISSTVHPPIGWQKEYPTFKGFLDMLLSCNQITEDEYINQCDYYGLTCCLDSDDGKNYHIKGYTEGTTNGTYWGESTDFCQSENELMEYSCLDDHDFMSSYTCPYGCKDGVCIQPVGLEDMENQLADISQAASDLRERIKELLGR